MAKKTGKVMIGKEISFLNGDTKVMLNANDLLVFLMIDTDDEVKEVTKYRLKLATQIAIMINEPII